MTTHPDCCATDRGDRRTLSKQEAIDFLLGQVCPLADIETVRTDAGLGRVLAAPVTSAIDVPGWDNSAMDGYAIRHRAGEDIRTGTETIGAGIRLGPAHLGLAASVGVASLQVYRRLRVAILASGDELAMPGEPLRPGQIASPRPPSCGPPCCKRPDRPWICEAGACSTTSPLPSPLARRMAWSAPMGRARDHTRPGAVGRGGLCGDDGNGPLRQRRRAGPANTVARV
jgi:hypothetical protein